MTKIFTLGLILFFPFQNIISQTILRMEKVNGVYQVPCKVNGIKMNFIFDTGASDISISKTEAQFLIKQGLLTKEDVVGSQNYISADGSIIEGTKILIDEIRINDIIIKDVNATVVDNINAPLLLGQSALERFGKYEIEKDVLRIYPATFRNKYEFLGIDLTKDITDFGLSAVNLVDANPLLPISFNYLKINENHIFKDIGFDDQKVIFNDKGKIAFIALQLKPHGKYILDRETFAKENFKNIVEIVNDKFSLPDSNMSRNAEWNSSDYQIMLSIDSDYSVLLLFRPKIINDIGNNLINGTSSQRTVNTKELELQDLRNQYAKLLEEILINSKFDIIVTSENKNLFIGIYKRFYDTKPSNSTLMRVIDNLAFDLFRKATLEKSNFDGISEMFDNILFKYDFQFPNEVNYKQVRKISKSSMTKLSYPINEPRFKRLLE